MTTKYRLQYIDIAKGIGIFLVVLGHVYRGNVVQNWLYSFHMPLFFFISGWLYNGNKVFKSGYITFIKKKARRFLVPYMVFILMNYIYWAVVEQSYRAFDQGPLWFLPVLLIVECCAILPIEWTNNNRNRTATSLFILMVGLICVGGFQIAYSGIFGWIVRVYNGIVWYYTGFCLSRYSKGWIESLSHHRYGRLYVACFFMLNVLSGCSNGRVDMYLNRFNNVFLYIIAASSGIFFCMGIAVLIGKNKALLYLGKYSLVIMCTHEPIKRAVIQVASIVTHVSSDALRNNILIGLLFAVIVLLIEVVTVETLRFFSKSTINKKIHIFFEYIN